LLILLVGLGGSTLDIEVLAFLVRWLFFLGRRFVGDRRVN
jgi:hypothetical protein